MILNRTWNRRERKFEISYLDKDGKRKLYEKYIHHWKTYEYDENGKYDTWNHKKCSEVYKDSSRYKPNEFDILEYLFNMENDEEDAPVLKELYANNPIRVYTYDIETEVSDEFPDPELAKQVVTSISLVSPEFNCYVLGLKSMTDEQCKLLKQRYLDFIHSNDFANQQLKKLILNGGKEPEVRYKKFDTEEQLLKYWFTSIIPNIVMLAGWNSYRFDRQYLVNRAKRLFGEATAIYMIKKGSPTNSLNNISWVEMDGTRKTCEIPMHMIELDYMELVKTYEYAFRPYESFSLDWCGEHIVKANKIKYEGTLQQLYERDYEWYYYYNAIDSLIVQLIHQRTKCIKSPASVGSVTLVGIYEAMGQIAMTTANLFRVFYDDGKHVVWDYDGINRDRGEYQGAFCAAVPGLHEWTACFDFKSLYPTQIRTCNFSFENFIQPMNGPDSLGRYTPRKWTEAELEQYRKDPNYFVSNQGHVYKNDRDYAYKRMQERNTKNRDRYKYLGQKINAQMLSEIDRLIALKENEESKK